VTLLNLRNVKPRLGDPEIFCDKFILHHFVKKNYITKILLFEKNNFKITTIADNIEGALKIFVLSYFEYCQVWLNILVMIVS
jgi:hypothetical protein